MPRHQKLDLALSILMARYQMQSQTYLANRFYRLEHSLVPQQLLFCPRQQVLALRLILPIRHQQQQHSRLVPLLLLAFSKSSY
jgi:hypothetical protein